jgi:hypothetical protein
MGRFVWKYLYTILAGMTYLIIHDRARRLNSVSLNGVRLRREDFDIRRLDNLHIQNMNERTSQIMLAVSLLSFIEARFGSDVDILAFIKRTVLDGSVVTAVESISGRNPEDFNRVWREFARV